MSYLDWFISLLRRRRRPDPVPAPPEVDGDVRAVILARINTQRSEQRIGPLAPEPRLAAAAQAHAEDLAQRDQPLNGISLHIGSDASTFTVRIRRQGYRFTWAEEVVAPGWFSVPGRSGQPIVPEDVVRRWLDDPLHRAVLLSRRSIHAGVGVATASSGTGYAVVDFATPLSV